MGPSAALLRLTAKSPATCASGDSSVRPKKLQQEQPKKPVISKEKEIHETVNKFFESKNKMCYFFDNNFEIKELETIFKDAIVERERLKKSYKKFNIFLELAKESLKLKALDIN